MPATNLPGGQTTNQETTMSVVMRRTTYLLTCILLLGASFANAQGMGRGMGRGMGQGAGGGQGAFWVSQSAFVPGDAKLGKAVAEQVCGACHGVDGNSIAAVFPKLAGQKEGYLARQLTNFSTHARDNDLMNPVAHQLSQDSLRNVAAWYATQTLQPANDGDSKLIAAGRRIFEAGDISQHNPPCTHCHLANPPPGPGAMAPLLAGQFASYLQAQLLQLRSGQRSHALMMPMMAARLSDAQIEAVAAYISQLH